MSQEPAGDLTQQTVRRHKHRRIVIILAATVCASLPVPIVWLLTEADQRQPNTMIATYILSGVLLFIEVAVLVLIKTARTRYTVEQHILRHREVNEYVILWDRPRWILYTPTMLLALLFGTVFSLGIAPSAFSSEVAGGIWVVVFILNVFVEQYHMSIRTVLIFVPTVGAILLALHLVGYAGSAIRLLRHFAVDVRPKLYFLTAAVIGLVIFIAWVQGLFHYIAITPNVADLQRGLTETGRQIKNDDYDVDFDATDVVERWLFGFGRIIISLKDPSKPPMIFFVPRASVVDERIRRVRSVTAIDRIPGEDV